MKSKQVILLLIFLALVLGVSFLLPKWNRFWAIDKCLDSGGRWDYDNEKCESQQFELAKTDAEPSGTLGVELPNFNEASIQYLTFETNANSSDEDTLICKNWKIENDQIIEILKSATPISGPDWHHLYPVYRCVANCDVIINSEIYKLSINAGSWMNLTIGDTTVTLGDTLRRHEKHFLGSVWREEDE